MNGILTNNSSKLEKSASTKSNKDVETAGSLAMNETPLFCFQSGVGYDMFIPSNPFSLNINCGYVNIDPNGGIAEHDTYIQNLNTAMNFVQTSSETGACAISAGAGSTVGSCSVGGGFLC